MKSTYRLSDEDIKEAVCMWAGLHTRISEADLEVDVGVEETWVGAGMSERFEHVVKITITGEQ